MTTQSTPHSMYPLIVLDPLYVKGDIFWIKPTTQYCAALTKLS